MGNDVSYIAGILLSMLIIAFIMPSLQAEFGVDVEQQNIGDETITNLEGKVEDMGTWSYLTGGFTIVSSLFNMFFWSYAWFPAWLIVLHIGIRIALIILIYRLIRSGGG